jgi:hypothetical protein
MMPHIDVSPDIELDLFFSFYPSAASRQHSASHWRMQDIAQESVDSSDEEFFDARG